MYPATVQKGEGLTQSHDKSTRHKQAKELLKRAYGTQQVESTGVR